MSIIDQMPAGRKEIITRWVKHEQLEVVLDWLVKELGKGSQAYFISPLIEESEALDLKNAPCPPRRARDLLWAASTRFSSSREDEK